MSDLYVGVPTLLGANGAEKVIEVELDADAKHGLQVSIDAVKELLAACKTIEPSLG